jgi:hypothetical protein
MTPHMQFVPTFNASVLVAMTILLTLLQSLVAGQAEVGTKPCTPFGHGSLALSTFQLRSISHEDSAGRSNQSVGKDRFSQNTDLAFSRIVRHLERMSVKASIANDLRET